MYACRHVRLLVKAERVQASHQRETAVTQPSHLCPHQKQLVYVSENERKKGKRLNVIASSCWSWY